jgi:hypothetical protein
MTDHKIECEVCGKQHEWSRGAKSNYRETALSNGEFIDHCLDCDPQVLKGANQ